MAKRISHAVVKGRGAGSNALSSRFDDKQKQTDGDWLDERSVVDGDPSKLRTQVSIEHPRTIITRNSSPDIPFDRSVNAYRGCEHGCIYCFARPTHAYHNLSPGIDFETKLFAKPNAPDLLRQELARPGYRVAPLAMGTNTDPYQPIESRYRITRRILELMLETGHPVGITTKSDRILRDMDLLVPLAEQGLVGIAISITSLDPDLSRILEPRAPSPAKRLAAVDTLVQGGVPCSVNLAPLIPAINDHELERIAEQCARVGASNFSTIPLRLPHEVAPLFSEWLDNHFPDRKAKVLSIVSSLRGGRLNDPRFGSRMRGEGPWADLAAQRLMLARRRHGFGKSRWRLRCDLFQPPETGGQMRFDF